MHVSIINILWRFLSLLLNFTVATCFIYMQHLARSCPGWNTRYRYLLYTKLCSLMSLCLPNVAFSCTYASGNLLLDLVLKIAISTTTSTASPKHFQKQPHWNCASYCLGIASFGKTVVIRSSMPTILTPRRILNVPFSPQPVPQVFTACQ